MIVGRTYDEWKVLYDDCFEYNIDEDYLYDQEDSFYSFLDKTDIDEDSEDSEEDEDDEEEYERKRIAYQNNSDGLSIDSSE